MPHKRKGSPYWWVKITPPGGKSIRRSTGTADYREAKALEGKWRGELFKQQAWGEDPPRPFAEVAATYLQHRIEEGARSLDDMRRRVSKLYDYFGADKDMAKLDGQDIRSFIAWRREPHPKTGRVVKSATVNRELDVLSAMINLANVELEWSLPNPVKGRTLDEPEGRVRWITRHEADRLVEKARAQRNGERLADFILLGLNTGARMNELLKLTWSRVDFDHALLHLEGEDNKTAKRRSIPLNLVAVAALRRRRKFVEAQCPESPWVFAKTSGGRLGNLREGFKSACTKAKISNFRIHDLRHTCASWLVSSGVPLLDVKEVLGHSTIKMAEKYSHLAPHRAREAVDKLGAQYRHKGNPVIRLESLTGRSRRA